MGHTANMARILVTGSAQGVGRNAATALLDAGHEVLVHVRDKERRSAVADLLKRGARCVVADLGRPDDVHDLAYQVVCLGGADAIIHNAGSDERDVLLVNVVAPYLLTALVPSARHIYTSSSMHRSGRADLRGLDWRRGNRRYCDAKLYVTALMAAVARLRPCLASHAVDPGWVPTRMGGASAPDPLELAHVTQVHLSTATDDAVGRSGRYWYHMRAQRPAPAVENPAFQDSLLAALADETGVVLA